MKISSRTLILAIAIFAIQPITYGAWLAIIPVVKAQLGLSKAELAMALLGMPFATVISLQFASRLIDRFGPRRVLASLFPVQAIALMLPGLAPSQATLFVGLMLAGAVMAFMQVALNVYAGRLEKQSAVSVMNRCHGAWAVGLMLGTLGIPMLIWLGPALAVFVIGLVSGVVGITVSLSLPHLGAPVGQASPARRRLRELPVALILISISILSITMSEGAMADWGAVYMSERMPADSVYFGLGVTVYAAFVAIGRLAGDALKLRIGAVALARIMLSFALVGLGLIALPLPLGAAFVGFACIGLGLSVGFPLGVSAVAALDDVHEGANIAIMSSIALCGFLIGPPLIGFLSELISLRYALLALVPGLILSMLLSNRLSNR
ncbi:MAG: MFS transporter [Marinosulfonomonas sp.]